MALGGEGEASVGRGGVVGADDAGGVGGGGVGVLCRLWWWWWLGLGSGGSRGVEGREVRVQQGDFRAGVAGVGEEGEGG